MRRGDKDADEDAQEESMKRSQQRGVNEEEQRWDSDEDDGEGRLLKRGCLERGVG